ATHLASHVHIRQEIHFDSTLAVPLTGLAATALDIETKPPRLISALARFGEHRIQFSYRSEYTRIGSGIRPRSSPDGRLIDLHHLINVLDASDGAVFAGFFHGAIQILRERAVQDVVDQRGFSLPRDARNNSQQTERERNVHIF